MTTPSTGPTTGPAAGPTKGPTKGPTTAAEVALQASSAPDVATLDARVIECRACPRLVAWREHIAATKRAAFADETYWGRPVPGFGPPQPRVLVVGLAPAAHGANRTGRMFTGDRSGAWLYAALHRAGYAALPASQSATDEQRLTDLRIVAPVRCAPPDNKPTTEEFVTCAPWLHREVVLAEPSLESILALGALAWSAVRKTIRQLGWQVPSPAPRFGHGATASLGSPSGRVVRLVGSYHVSQQNTFTGRLTAQMLDDAVALLR